MMMWSGGNEYKGDGDVTGRNGRGDGLGGGLGECGMYRNGAGEKK